MSQENRGGSQVSILKVYDAEEVSRTIRRLECEGRARTSAGGWMGLTFYLEEDSDGDRFIGYGGTGPVQ